MKKVFKLMAVLFGAITLITGASSCNKEDDNECCTFSYTMYDSETFSATACEDGSVTYTYGSTTITDSWTTYASNWDEAKANLQEYEDITCE